MLRTRASSLLVSNQADHPSPLAWTQWFRTSSITPGSTCGWARANLVVAKRSTGSPPAAPGGGWGVLPPPWAWSWSSAGLHLLHAGGEHGQQVGAVHRLDVDVLGGRRRGGEVTGLGLLVGEGLDQCRALVGQVQRGVRPGRLDQHAALLDDRRGQRQLRERTL